MDKKFTPQEVAAAVLAKAKEMYDASNLAKADQYDNQVHQKGVHQGVPSKDNAGTAHSHSESMAGHAVRQGIKAGATGSKLAGKTKQNFTDTAKARHENKLSELKAMPKPNLTKSDATIAMSEQNQTPPDGVQKESIGQHDPAAGKENGNPPWGTEPGSYKLAKFMGHRDAKRKQKVPQNGQ